MIARALRFDAAGEVEIDGDLVRVRCTGREAVELASAVAALLSAHGPRRTGQLAASVRREGAEVRVGGPSAPYAKFVEIRKGFVSKAVEEALTGAPPADLPAVDVSVRTRRLPSGWTERPAPEPEPEPEPEIDLSRALVDGGAEALARLDDPADPDDLEGAVVHGVPAESRMAVLEREVRRLRVAMDTLRARECACAVTAGATRPTEGGEYMSQNREVREATTCLGTLSYPHLETADQYQGKGEHRFRASLVFVTDHELGASPKQQLGNVIEAVKAAAAEKFENMPLSDLHLCIQPVTGRDLEVFQDTEALVLRASSKVRPALFDAYGNRLDPEKDPGVFDRLFYAGAICRFRIWTFPYMGDGPGVSAVLQGVQHYEDGTPLGRSGGEITMEAMREPPEKVDAFATPAQAGGPEKDDGLPF